MSRAEQPKAVGLGAGGHGKVVLDALQRQGGWSIVGLLDTTVALKGQTRLGVAVLGGPELLPELVASGVRAVFIGVGGASSNAAREKVYREALAAGAQPMVVIHPAADVAQSAIVGPGSVVLAGAVVNPEAQVAENRPGGHSRAGPEAGARRSRAAAKQRAHQEQPEHRHQRGGAGHGLAFYDEARLNTPPRA